MPTMTNPQRALQVWSLLAFAAMKRTVITYKEIAELTGLAPDGCGSVLGHILQYCMQNNLPKLTWIAVKDQTGKPHPSVYGDADLAAEQWRCFHFDWRQHRPSIEDVQERYTTNAVA